MTSNAEMPTRADQIPPGNSLGRFHSHAEMDGTLGAVEDTLEGPQARP